MLRATWLWPTGGVAREHCCQQKRLGVAGGRGEGLNGQVAKYEGAWGEGRAKLGPGEGRRGGEGWGGVQRWITV